MSFVEVVGVLAVVSAVLTVFFGYLYYKDRDERKLMFMLVFAFTTLAHIGEISYGLGSPISEKIFAWSPLPTISAILIAVFFSLGNHKDFRNTLHIFLISLLASIIMIFSPIPVSINLEIVYTILLTITILAAIYVVLTRKTLPDSMFLLSTVCFTLAEVSRITRFARMEITLFMELSAHIFIALVFLTAKESTGSNIASFFSIKDELKKTQQELENSQEQLMKAEYNFKSLIDVIADPVVIVDKKGHFLEINDTVRDRTGFTRDELLGKNFLKTNIVTTKSKAILIKKLTERMMGINVKPYEVEANTKSGKTIQLEVNAKKIEYKGKNADLVIFHDITERKILEKEQEKYAEQLEKEVKDRTKTVREHEEKLQSIFDSSPDAIAVFNLKGNITDCNKAALDFLGVSTKEEVINKNGLMFVTKKDQHKIKKTMNNVLKTSSVTNVGYTALNKGNKMCPAEFSASVIKDQSNKPVGFVAIIKDITERHKMENELRCYSEQLEELVEKRTKALKKSQKQLVRSERLAAIGEAATMVGHDLRNPLQAIENGIYYIDTELSKFKVPQRTKETLQSIHNSIDYADNIVKDLQHFAAKREPLLRETDINTIIKESLLCIKKPENIEINRESSKVPKIEIDKDMIKRVFVNLIVNGIQAMQEKGGLLTISTKKSKGYIKVSFKDMGKGINKENKKKLFTPFFTTKAQGMGVGLAICKRFVERHNGNITVESEEGKGSIFTVKLPIRSEEVGKLD
ncbi:MAG: PAS domain S-box protein [Candidatus Bathyarchaeota archaeon]|nr:PAS domain S-box protein [Candidatus Bathyarchaeum sp.]